MSNIETQQAVLIDHGPDNYDWSRAKIANGDECFLYPDSARTVDPKYLPIGTILEIHGLQPCSRPGNTKWSARAIGFELQNETVKQLVDPGYAGIVDIASDEPEPETAHLSKKDLIAEYSTLRHHKILEIVKKHSYMKGRCEISKAVAHAIDLCILHNLS